MVLILTHCLSYDFSRRFVQQGNLLPQAKINQLKIGMSKESVATLMGTSLISPMFNEQRWDYAFTQRTGSGTVFIKDLSLYFEANHLSRIDMAKT